MKKIRLELESVEVESFPAEEPRNEPAVEGFAASRPGDTWCVTCGESCDCTFDYCTLGIC
jgi:hypothetical protein